MITLYILSGLATYLGIGYQCAVKGLDYSAYHNTSKKSAVKNARKALFFWPWWLYDKGTEILFWHMFERKQQKLLEERNQEREIQKLLESGEI